MRYIFSYLVFSIVFITHATAQKKWSLLECVNYAMENNIGIKQTALQAKVSDLQLKQDKQGQYPTLNLNNNYGVSFGRRENPTTGIFEDQRFFNTGLNMQSSVSIFGKNFVQQPWTSPQITQDQSQRKESCPPSHRPRPGPIRHVARRDRMPVCRSIHGCCRVDTGSSFEHEAV